MSNLERIDEYKYLWDGSQPGWVLKRFCGNYIDLSLAFPSTGPSTRELMSVRRTVAPYRALPVKEVVTQLRGQESLLLGRFEPKEARVIAAACRREDLNLVESIVDAPEFLPMNELTGVALIIEDDLLAEHVYTEALLHGIPVRQVEL